MKNELDFLRQYLFYVETYHFYSISLYCYLFSLSFRRELKTFENHVNESSSSYPLLRFSLKRVHQGC